MNIALPVAFFAFATASLARPLSEVLADPRLDASFRLDAAGEVIFKARNTGTEAQVIAIPAPTVLATAGSARWFTIREAEIVLAPGERTEMRIPALRMSMQHQPAPGPLTLSAEKPACLDALIHFSKAHDDLPRPTAQLAAWMLLEDISYPQWIATLAAGSTPPDAARFTVPPEQLSTGIDALAIAKGLFPGRAFALAQAPEFRMRVLRFAKTRPKAMALFGMTAPEGIPEASIEDLLHTKPGDNCPICRWRGKMRALDSGP